VEYYRLLGLQREPFSNSPDPFFLYRSRMYDECLNWLEISLRLRRGLNVVLGDVGTGKTTVSRALLQGFGKEGERFLFHIVMDPVFDSQLEFMKYLAKAFDVEEGCSSISDYRNALESFLFRKGVEENRVVVLIIDEAQKLSADILEILRILLNYETNEYKLLQLILFGQMELLPKLKKLRNFMDRISFFYKLKPLNEKETKEMIRYRLQKAGLPKDRDLFTEDAISLIYSLTGGYPRRITMLCHEALITMLVKGARIVDDDIVGIVVEKRKDLI